MIDNYTKIILTIIAATLVILVLSNVTQPATALVGDCGSSRYDPCYVEVTGGHVKVTGGSVRIDGPVKVWE